MGGGERRLGGLGDGNGVGSQTCRLEVVHLFPFLERFSPELREKLGFLTLGLRVGGDLDLDLLRDGERDLHLGPPLLPLALPLLPPGLLPLGEGDLECLPSGFPRVLDVTPLVANDSGNFNVSA